ncbi:hypothetical protein [Paractinoplanes hotanensis]|uniref:Glycosyl hydrolase family 98 putative carbohydrate-binding module domain-containing protein n=1 Tax=Paractinoplanes hotanensis TaxID=2906497 RepID=A0ABT0XWY8_9ACTN|nr:hypothetical protein [Actinoplanes hotanensis]MCM4078308.1 hypothetical protein [Actinoplanes hotanensis]
MSGSSGSTAAKVTVGGIVVAILATLGAVADVSSLFSFITGNTLNDLQNSEDGGAANGPRSTGSKLPSSRARQPTSPPTSPVQGPPPAYLNDLEPVGGSNSFNEKGTFYIDGREYVYSMSFATTFGDESEAVEFALQGRYSKLYIALGLRGDAPEDQGPSACHWRILGDGRELKEGKTVRGKHIEIKSLKISGVVHLKIVATQTKGIENAVPWPCTMGNAKVS